MFFKELRFSNNLCVQTKRNMVDHIMFFLATVQNARYTQHRRKVFLIE